MSLLRTDRTPPHHRYSRDCHLVSALSHTLHPPALLAYFDRHHLVGMKRLSFKRSPRDLFPDFVHFARHHHRRHRLTSPVVSSLT